MTKQEKIIVSAYTGVLMCDFVDVHEYIEKKIGRPIFTHELANKGIQEEIKEKTKGDFLTVCGLEGPEPIKIHIDHDLTAEEIKNLKRMIAESPIVIMSTAQPERLSGKWGEHGECPFCGYLRQWEDDRFCGNCGADMRGEQDD